LNFQAAQNRSRRLRSLGHIRPAGNDGARSGTREDIHARHQTTRLLKGAAAGALAFTVGGAEVLLTPRAARAQGVPLRTLSAAQAGTLDALGETLVPGARQAGISHFVDQQLSIPPEEALLEARSARARPEKVTGKTPASCRHLTNPSFIKIAQHCRALPARIHTRSINLSTIWNSTIVVRVQVRAYNFRVLGLFSTV
jgi:hypothetical protein